ncbi:MAG: tryptophan 7-halogenase [Pirellulaceae bacterium]|jgi:FADH2 O2-dependent halogenase|nr:tryptophan 7-halogenase [Pirellulaceae bacterium]
MDFNIIVIGSGFAGSLAAAALSKIGFRVALIDRGHHPRFAIGESSTPTANLVLRDIAKRYGLEKLEPLTRYGTWRNTYPDTTCGLKRGFSYFHHDLDHPFQPFDDHRNELVVAASRSDAVSDTHWLRADVDQLFATIAAESGAVGMFDREIRQVARVGSAWKLVVADRDGQIETATAEFLVDASGRGGVLQKQLGLPDRTQHLAARSRAIYTHVAPAPSWTGQLEKLGGRVADHPFHADHAAQHHLFANGWWWLLPFDDGTCSVGLARQMNALPSTGAESTPVEEIRHWLERLPTLHTLLEPTSLRDVPGRWIDSGRLQHRVGLIAGPGYALLPHAAGFVDPLHSTGIAHSLCGLERLLLVLEQTWGKPELADQLARYAAQVDAELDLIDRIVDCGYGSLDHFELFVATTMLYFAGATGFERRRDPRNPSQTLFLCAQLSDWQDLVRRAHEAIRGPGGVGRGNQDPKRLAEALCDWLQPFNHVGLCDKSLQNMYGQTAAEM